MINKNLNINGQTKHSKDLLEWELSEKYICDAITEFQCSNFENNANGVNTANEQISNIYMKLSSKCMKKKLS